MSSFMKWKSAGLLLDRAAAAFLRLNGNVYEYQHRWSTVYNNPTEDQCRPYDVGFSHSLQELEKLPWKINNSGLNISVINADEIKLNPNSKEFIPQSKQSHVHFESYMKKPLILDPSAKEFNPQSTQRHDNLIKHMSQSLNLNPRACEFIPQSKQNHDHFETYKTKPLIVDPSAKEFNPQSKQRHDILMIHKSQSLNLNPRADEFIPHSKQRHLDLEITPLSAKPRVSLHQLRRNNNMELGKTFLMRLEECMEHATEEDIKSSDYSDKDQQPTQFQTSNPLASPFKILVANATLRSEDNIQNVEKSPESRTKKWKPLNPFANPFVSLKRDAYSSSSFTENTKANLQQKHSAAEALTSTLKELLRKRPNSFKLAPTECIKRFCAITEHFEKDHSQMDGFSKMSQLCTSLNPSAKEFYPQSGNQNAGASNLGDILHNFEEPCAASNANNSTAEHAHLNPNAKPFISQLRNLRQVAYQTDSLILNKREQSATSVHNSEIGTESMSASSELRHGKHQLSSITESILQPDISFYTKDTISTLHSTTTAITAAAPTISESSNQSSINEDTTKSDFRRTPRRQYQGPLRREFADDLPEINGPYSPSQYECLRILRNLPFLKHDEILDAPKQQSNVPNYGRNLQEKPENGQQFDMCFVEKHPLRFPEFFF